MSEHILIYALIGCGYSQLAVQLLKVNNIKHKIISVRQDDKDYYKTQNNMNTFPQIFYIDSNGKKDKIGGYNDLNIIINTKTKIRKNIGNYDKVINNRIPNINKNLLIRVLLLTF